MERLKSRVEKYVDIDVDHNELANRIVTLYVYVGSTSYKSYTVEAEGCARCID